MTVPNFTEKCLSQSRQRCGLVLLDVLGLMFTEPHLGHAIPSGHRFWMNHCSAVSSSGKMRNKSMREMPLRKCLPGAFCAILLSPMYELLALCTH